MEKQDLIKRLENMKSVAQSLIDNEVYYFSSHALSVLEFAENALAVLEELATERAFKDLKDLFQSMNLTDEERDELFKRGIFNDIAIGYGKIALIKMGIPHRRQEFENAMRVVLDLFSAKEARTMYEKD